MWSGTSQSSRKGTFCPRRIDKRNVGARRFAASLSARRRLARDYETCSYRV
jgi:hypothetical protein